MSQKSKIDQYTILEAVRDFNGLTREVCQRSLYRFMRESWNIIEPADKYVDNWHIGCISEHLQALSDLEIQNLVINIPPRHCKSTLICAQWQAWHWTREPGSRWMFGSYSDDLVVRDSLRALQILESDWYRSKWGDKFQLSKKKKSPHWFENDVGGRRLCSTIGGRALGQGGNFIIADDPHKAIEINSTVMRNSVINWWTQTMSTRADDPAQVRKLIIMQRLHERDLSGYVLSEGLGYEHLCLPAEHEPGRIVYSIPDNKKEMPRHAIIATKIQRDENRCEEAKKRGVILRDPRHNSNELLWPNRFTQTVIDDLKRTLREGWSGQGQQRPAASEGIIFKSESFRYFKITQIDGVLGIRFGEDVRDSKIHFLPMSVLRFYQCIDTAMREHEQAAYTVIGTFAEYNGLLFVFDMFRERVQFPDLVRAVNSLREGPTKMIWNGAKNIFVRTTTWPKEIQYQAVEDKSSGISLIQVAMTEGIPLKKLYADADKVTRSGIVANMYEAGMVFHMEGAEWLYDFEDELQSFPTAAFLDQVDVMSYAGIDANATMLQRKMYSGGGSENVFEDSLQPGESEEFVDREIDNSEQADQYDWMDDD